MKKTPHLSLSLSRQRDQNPPVGMRRRTEASTSSLANRPHAPLSTSTNRRQPTKPAVGPALALALLTPGMPEDAKSGIRVRACTLTHSPCAAHERARHRVHVTTRPLHRTLADPDDRVAHHFSRYGSETAPLSAKPSSQPMPLTLPLESVHNAAPESCP
jgi:hypothetical protein